MGENKSETRRYTKADTSIAKGIAILCMVFHHVYPNNCYTPGFLIPNNSFLSVIASTCKACVALLTVLSGYGLAESYKYKGNPSSLIRDIRFVISRIIQIISIYWPINTMVSFIQIGTGKIEGNAYNVFCCFLGLKRFVGSWFLIAIIVLYALFPLLFRLINKCGSIVVALTYLPWFIFIIHLINPIDIKWDSVPFYIFPFSVGIFLSINRKLKKATANSKSDIIKWVIIFVLVLCIRYFLTLPVDTFVALVVIKLQSIIVCKRKSGIRKSLELLGNESANIWLVHTVIVELISRYFNSWYLYLFEFVFIVIISVIISKTINYIKNKTLYNKCIKKMRLIVEGVQ